MKLLLFAVSLLAFNSVHATGLSSRYGAYKLTYGDEDEVGIAFVYPSYESQNDTKNTHIMFRKSSQELFFAELGSDAFDRWIVEYKGKFNLSMKSICNDIGNERFKCDGVIFDSLTAYTLDRLKGKVESDLFTDQYEHITAPDYVGTLSIPISENNTKLTKSKVTFSLSLDNFLNVQIENMFSRFEGFAKPMGKNSLYIYYQDELGQPHGIDCLALSNNQKVSTMTCKGSLDGVHAKSEYNSFILER